MELPKLDDHNKKVEEEVAKGRPGGFMKRAGVMCSVCFERDKSEIELTVPDQEVKRAVKNILSLQVFCPNCKKSYWMAL